MLRKLIIPTLLLLITTSVFAQEKVVADKIAGIVGDKIILRSDLIAQIADMQRNAGGQELKGVDECSILDGMLIQKALVFWWERSGTETASRG